MGSAAYEIRQSNLAKLGVKTNDNPSEDGHFVVVNMAMCCFVQDEFRQIATKQPTASANTGFEVVKLAGMVVLKRHIFTFALQIMTERHDLEAGRIKCMVLL